MGNNVGKSSQNPHIRSQGFVGIFLADVGKSPHLNVGKSPHLNFGKIPTSEFSQRCRLGGVACCCPII